MRWPQIMLMTTLCGSAALAAAQAADIEAVAQWAEPVTLSTPVSGVVQQVSVTPGEQVDEGDVLLLLDPRPFKARRQLAQAQVQALEPALAEAAREVERAEELYDRTVLSDVEREQARIAFARASGAYKSAEARAELAQLDQEYSRLRAPYAARVLGVHVYPGEAVVNQQQAVPMISVARSDRLWLRAALKPEQAAELQLGQELAARLAGMAVEGRIVALEAEGTEHYLVLSVPRQAGQIAGLEAVVELP